MKKAFDQTVRDLKREVNKKVLKVPRIEQKVLDATSNEPWGPHGTLLADIAHATRNYAEFQIIMSLIWKRINDTGKNWRHVYKGLTVLEYLVAHGSEKIIDEIREHSYQIATLSEFQYISSSGRDEGSNVRKKSQSLVALVNDKERIQEVRQKAHANRDKYRGSFSTGGGNYGDQYEDDQYHGSHGSRDDHRNGYGRGDDDRYGRRDPYGRDGDRYSRDGDDYRGNRGSEDYQFGSRNRNLDGDKGRSFDEEDRYSSRSGGGRMDEPSQDDRKLEQNLDAPPSYEETVGERESHNRAQNEKDGVGQIPVAKAPAPAAAANPPPSESVNLAQAPPVSTLSHTQKEQVDAFDEFDPRGSSAAALPKDAGVAEMDFFGLSGVESINSLALVPVTAPTSSQEEHFPNSFESVQNLATPFNGFDQAGENPFGEPAFRAVPTARETNQSPPIQPQPSLSPSPYPFGENVDSFTAPPPPPPNPSVNGHHLPPSAAVDALPSGLASLQPVAGVALQTNSSTFYAPQPNLPANNSVHPQPYPSNFLAAQGQEFSSPYPFPVAVPQQSFSQTPQARTMQIAAPSFSSALVVAAPPPAKDKFETKSTVWADTLSRGLVDLNISGPKTNPLADIGVDFDSINRKEKRKEKEKTNTTPVSTINMGKAMGAGSGMGLAGAVGLPPPNPLVSSRMGMGMMNQPMGMGMGGYGGGINQPPTGMNMGMGMGMKMGISPGGMPPGGMSSVQNMRGNNGYNPMAGMGGGGYGSQPYGGYR